MLLTTNIILLIVNNGVTVNHVEEIQSEIYINIRLKNWWHDSALVERMHVFLFLFLNWNSLQARLKSQSKALQKKKHKKIKAYEKSV